MVIIHMTGAERNRFWSRVDLVDGVDTVDQVLVNREAIFLTKTLVHKVHKVHTVHKAHTIHTVHSVHNVCSFPHFLIK